MVDGLLPHVFLRQKRHKTNFPPSDLVLSEATDLLVHVDLQEVEKGLQLDCNLISKSDKTFFYLESPLDVVLELEDELFLGIERGSH